MLQAELRNAGSLSLEVKAMPGARSSEIVERMPDGVLKVRIAAAPERGRANKELCALLANVFGVAKRNVQVTAGHTSQRKRVYITL